MKVYTPEDIQRCVNSPLSSRQITVLKTKSEKEKQINVVTLGCAKNLVDSENMITQLQANDFAVTHEEEKPADIVIVNTCGFIDVAKEESIDTILSYAQLRTRGDIEKLYVTGCLSQRYREDLEKEIPEVDAWYGTLELPSLLNDLNADYKHELIGERSITTPPHYAYIKISEGCNRTCAFCAIPLIRGKHISRPIDQLVKEVTHLANQGVREIMLIAQELTYYGLDIYKKRALPELLHALADIEGIAWIRLHYSYPSKFPLEIIDAMAERDEICNYLDIPLQHASDPVLKAMRRQITAEETDILLDAIRQRLPGIHIRTTFLVGFPGETEEDFQTLLDFVRKQQFERVGVFQYSHEENTIAHDLPDDVPPEIKAVRANRLMELQKEISFDKNLAKIGSVQKVLIDRKEDGYYIGRTEADSPGVDNEVLIRAQDDTYLRLGDFAMIEIIDATEYDLMGRIFKAVADEA